MPTLLRIGAHRFQFHSREHDPPHVHVRSPDAWAEFELSPTRLRASREYTDRELGRIVEIVIRHRAQFLGRWDEYLGH